MAIQRRKGSCHCGTVTFEADIDFDQTLTCNCSRCQRLGVVLAFAPPSGVELLSGEANLTDYTFNKRIVRHKFCKVCGIEPFALGTKPDGTQTVAVNVNCIEGVDLRALPSKHFDGRSL